MTALIENLVEILVDIYNNYSWITSIKSTNHRLYPKIISVHDKKCFLSTNLMEYATWIVIILM